MLRFTTPPPTSPRTPRSPKDRLLVRQRQRIINDRTGAAIADTQRHFKLRYGKQTWRERFDVWLETNGLETYNEGRRYRMKLKKGKLGRTNVNVVEDLHGASVIPGRELRKRVTRSMTERGDRETFWKLGAGVRI